MEKGNVIRATNYIKSNLVNWATVFKKHFKNKISTYLLAIVNVSIVLVAFYTAFYYLSKQNESVKQIGLIAILSLGSYLFLVEIIKRFFKIIYLGAAIITLILFGAIKNPIVSYFISNNICDLKHANAVVSLLYAVNSGTLCILLILFIFKKIYFHPKNDNVTVFSENTNNNVHGGLEK